MSSTAIEVGMAGVAGLLSLSACIYLISANKIRQGSFRWTIALAGLGVLASLLAISVSLKLVSGVYRSGSLMLLILAFIPTSYQFFPNEKNRYWVIASLVSLAIFMISRFMPAFASGEGEFLAGVLGFFYLLLLVRWLILAQRKAKNPVIRNRLAYLLLLWSIFLLGDFALLIGRPSLSISIMAAGVWGSTILVIAHKLPSFRYTIWHFLNYAILTLAASLLSLLGFWFAGLIDLQNAGWKASLVVLGFSIGLVCTILILKQLVPHLVNRLIRINQYDQNRILREFSLGISNINSPAILATISIGMISEAVELQRGYLFEVDYEARLPNSFYRLHGVGGMGQIPEELENSQLGAESPFIDLFRQARKPLLASDIVSSPEFDQASDKDRQWFSKLDMEVFAPVHTKDEWIGLICLGPKISGAAYYENDLALIGTLADQLSLALYNVRLIDSLMRVNQDFRRAYTALEQSNRQLQQVINQLEKIDQTKTDFISVSSHELRTPLTIIRGYSEILLEEQTIQQNDYYLKAARGIHSGIMRLNEIVERMLDVASLDARSYKLNKQPQSLSYVINSVYQGLKKDCEERNISLVLENISDLPIIEIDGESLKKVFNNLISNAVKYTPDGGRVTVTGVVVSAGQLGFSDGGIEIIVTDNGIGIDPENLDLIFNKFFQTGKISLHSTGKTKYKGSGPGLGLAIAKGIVEAHGGKIWAESKGYDEQVFPGSQFHVVLPLNNQKY